VTEVVALVVDGDERVGDGGFLALRRLRLRNRRADGTTSRGYVCDAVVRPYGQDAVVVAVWARRRGRRAAPRRAQAGADARP
jgi:ADP-ribose pyrophosphatase